jgi:6-phosphogluconate dehydrogenase
MVHNGIEYGIMELLSEVYDLLKSALGLSAAEMQKIFAAWNRTELNSYLVEITAAVLGHTDSETGQPIVDIIVDKAGQKGTGKWASQNALDLGVAIPTINAALEGRILSGARDERIAASKILAGPAAHFEGDRDAFIEALRQALRLAIVTCYAQGFALMREASKEYGYHLHFSEIARTWKGGCIIRAKLLEPIKQAFLENPDLVNLLVDSRFSALVNELQGSLRAVVARAAGLGVPVLALAASLNYIDAYRRPRMPANLLQAQRDYFGAHTYERLDKPGGGKFHTHWLE